MRSQPTTGRTDRRRIQLEVESVAYIVCDALGLDTGDYSFAYVARWSSGDTDVIKETGERVIRCAKEILENLQASDSTAWPSRRVSTRVVV